MTEPKKLTLGDIAYWIDKAQHEKWCGRPDVPVQGYSGEGVAIREAAALIASQAARIRELEEGLQPMADVASDIPDDWPAGHQCVTSIDHFRRARSLLSRKGGE